MERKDSSNKVISLAGRLKPRDTVGENMAVRRKRSNTRVIAITSGKGGVGKTNIVANLGFAFSKLGKKVLILDADMGLGNLDVLLGLAPKHNLSHVILGEKRVADIILQGPGEMLILPASSGIQELTQLSYEQKIKIFSELDQVIDTVDYLLIDTAAGISSNVMDFNASAHEIVVVVSPEPTSITDAYALMKVLSLKYAERCCRIIVNLVANAEEGAEVFRQLNMVTDRFLDIHISYLGSVVFDEKITRSIKHQKIICESYPQAAACKCLYRLAEKISVSPPGEAPAGESHFFWNHLIPQQLV